MNTLGSCTNFSLYLGYLVDMFKLGNFTLKNFNLIIRTSDEACIRHHQCSTMFLSSYCMMKIFEIILIEDLNLWRGTSTKYNTVVLVNDIQFNICIQVQSYVYTSSIQFQKISKFNHNDTNLNLFFKFQSLVQVD